MNKLTAWPSGLRRQLKALVRKGVGSNPTAVILVRVSFFRFQKIGFNFKSEALQHHAAIAQLGERQTEDLEVPGSIPGLGSVTLFLT